MMSGTNNEVKDLEVLRREYRNMEVNRRTFADESNSILRKQVQTLEKLRSENDSLKTDVATLQARTTLKPLNSFEQGKLDKVTIEIERYHKSIDNERKRITNLERQVASFREKIWNHRRLMGGANAATSNQRNVEKQVKILENRLDQALVKFNKSLAKNRKLREEIDNLRGERVTFDGVYKKLEKGLQDQKRHMAQVIEQSNLAYEQRDRSRLESVALEQANKKEQEQFDRQIEEIGKTLEKEIQAAAERRKKLPSNISSMDEETKAAAEKAAKAIALNKEKQACALHRREKIQNFEEALRKIAFAIGISDVDELVHVFITNDEQNFSFFTYANEQTNEVEKLEEQVERLKEEQSKRIQENGPGANEYEMSLNAIEEKIQGVKMQEEKYLNKSEESQLRMDSVKDGIKMLLTRLDCHDNELLGEVVVNETNMLHYLGVIEARTNEILYNYNKRNMRSRRVLSDEKRQEGDYNTDENSVSTQSHSDSPRESEWASMLGVGPELPMIGEQISVNPPRLTDYSSDDCSIGEGDGSSRPLTREELECKTASRLNQSNRRTKKGLTDGAASTRKGNISRRRNSLVNFVERK